MTLQKHCVKFVWCHFDVTSIFHFNVIVMISFRYYIEMTWNNIVTHQNRVVWKLQVYDQQEKLKTEDQVLVMKIISQQN